MSTPFHPDLSALSDLSALPDRSRVHLIRGGELSGDTAQTSGMRRLEAISGKSVGAQGIWTGETHVAPATSSGDHHHGEAETSIYVVSGHPRFVFHDGTAEVVVATQPGDYVFVPPFVPHREENPDPTTPAVVVISRTTQEGIVVNLPGLGVATDTRPDAPDRLT